ncbi:hypothetical protein [Mesorhizobium sp.]|uniref:hypothetical protein n=1 Tax=Mesorhizobium sp. TaxID=1871066 RepID=UPI000FE934F1|nr:hypothetical protein [Mesorhizobium sp.]RWP05089.1 MAG: hypothetical protein EOQ99_16595 [Mesorhizobium sp.]
MPSEALTRAKRLSRETANTTNIFIKLSLLDDLIAEIERLEKALGPTTVRAIRQGAEVPAMKHTGIKT